MLLTPAFASAQPAPRRLATITALRQFPGFFHLQNILMRGEFAEDGGRILFRAEDGDVRAVMERDVRTTSGPVEIRGQMVDVGRLDPGDARVPDSETRDATRWPRPGEEIFIRVTAVAAAEPSPPVSIRALALEPWRYEGQKITVTGNFRGRNLFGDLPGAPGKNRWEFVIRGAEGAAWVSGLQPRGRGFDLDIDRRVDTDQWLEVTGVVAYERGLVRIDATDLATAKAPQVIRDAEPPAPAPALPPLEVVFSSPTPAEDDVSPTTAVRIQFSRGLDTRTIQGAVKVSYAATGAAAPAFKTTYDAATRSLTLRFGGPLEAGATVRVEVVDTLKSFDGAPVAPWTLTFTVED